MKIYIGTDHGGFALKKKIKQRLSAQDHEVIDCGNTVLDGDDDYTDFGHAVARNVANDPSSRGILLCTSGIGMSIVANKHKGVRAALAHDATAALHTREDNDANVLCLDSHAGEDAVMDIVTTFLDTPFSDIERHKRRVDKIEQTEA